MGKKQQQEDLLKTLGDFTSKDNWDKFFTIRGSDDSFEWYAEWPQLCDPLLSHLPTPPPAVAEVEAEFPVQFSCPAVGTPGCPNTCTTPDSVMLRTLISRSFQFPDEAFEAVLDKGGLDALMEPELGPKLGSQYLSEVKRVLKSGGKFICLTLGEAHVLVMLIIDALMVIALLSGLLFSKFRYGWNMSLHAIPQKSSNKPTLQTFMVIAQKGTSAVLQQISSTFNRSSIACYEDQARGLFEALETENKVRAEHANGSDILYSFEDLQLGAEGDLGELSPGRRIQLTLGEAGRSHFTYRSVILDAQQQSDPFLYHCGVFLVPKTRAREWLFCSEEGQWTVVESSRAARLVMVLLDVNHTSASIDDIQKDLSPVVRQLAPGKHDNGAQIPFLAASDGIKQRKVIHQITSSLTGPIIVDDVVYETVDDDVARLFPSQELIFRRLTFERSEALVQSEALLTIDGCLKIVGKKEQKKTRLSFKSKKKGYQKRNSSHVPPTDDSSYEQKVDHNYLASSYHTGIISGFMLISTYLESVTSSGRAINAIVIGLGAGLLPMFLHRCLPFLHVEVVELDPVVLNLARDYFDFREDERLRLVLFFFFFAIFALQITNVRVRSRGFGVVQVHVADGIQFIRDVASNGAADEVTTSNGDKDVLCNSKPPSSDGSGILSPAEGKWVHGVDILVVDVDSSDSRSGMTCPAVEFVEESFLLTVKKALSEHGLFVINLVSRSPAIKGFVVSRMKTVFSNLFSLRLEKDVNEVVFAVNKNIEEVTFQKASHQLEKLLKIEPGERRQNIIDVAKKIKRT
ncbi:hypothetical protein RJ639_015352 [Escallonia herrerae]|uniref:Methyltransferase type 11 domain-containing protein n=1 Tax=Escallonia herrerae TaxID=1293975 RepID=A0AA88VIE8_9ASTE|nr:hypothetical protein RJ639_015352 [Escallonia herrerae]